jgi:hypothetical protein
MTSAAIERPVAAVEANPFNPVSSTRKRSTELCEERADRSLQKQEPPGLGSMHFWIH